MKRAPRLTPKEQRAEFVKNYNFGFEVRPLLRMKKAEEILAQVIQPVPSRRILTGLIKQNKIEGKRTRFGYVVFEDSFMAWLRRTAPPAPINRANQSEASK